MRPIAMASVAALCLPLAAAADFEGYYEAKMTGPREGASSGTIRGWIRPDGARTEMEMSSPEMEKRGLGKSARMVTIQKFAQPGVVYFIDDERKTWSSFESPPSETVADKHKWTATRLGPDKVAGWECDGYRATNEEGNEFEFCVTKEISPSGNWMRSMKRWRDSGIMQALKSAGANGYPIRWIHRKGGKTDAAMEATVIRRERVPASRIEIPPGYAKSETLTPFSSPEMSKKMQEAMEQQRKAMENMTPEQRQQFEEMMKKYGGKQ